MTPNHDLMANAREHLRGKWGPAVAIAAVWLGISILVACIPFVGWLGGLIIEGPLSVGMALYFLALVQGRDNEVGWIFRGFSSSFGNSFIAALLTSIFILLWSLLLIVPGIIAALSYSMTFFILAENPKLDGYEAIRRSKAMMKGNRWKLFCLWLRFLGWFLVGLLTLCIGFLWIVPYWMTSIANFYLDIRGAAPAEPVFPPSRPSSPDDDYAAGSLSRRG